VRQTRLAPHGGLLWATLARQMGFVVSRPFRKVREKDGARCGFIDPRVGKAGGRLILNVFQKIA
jgi:hypothetical protein